MDTYPPKLSLSNNRSPRLRALVEVIDGELKIFPICDSDVEAAAVLDALRFIREDFER